MEFLYTYTWGHASFPYEVSLLYGIMTYDAYVAARVEWGGGTDAAAVGATSSTTIAPLTAGPGSGPVQVQLRGLTPGTDYAFSLVATNVAGTGTATGAFSTPVSGTVTPGPVTSVTVVSGPTTDTHISVVEKWAAPTTGAAPTT